MMKLLRPAAVGILLAAMGAGTAIAQDVAADRDLTAVIALQGLPCGKVVQTAQQGADDFVATCSDGNRYRVYVDADGRVNVKKL